MLNIIRPGRLQSTVAHSSRERFLQFPPQPRQRIFTRLFLTITLQLIVRPGLIIWLQVVLRLRLRIIF